MSEEVDAMFAASVLGWVQHNYDPLAVEVTRVYGYGSAWEGSTEQGFYDTFTAYIDWRREDDTTGGTSCAGETMGSLWDWVIKGRRP